MKPRDTFCLKGLALVVCGLWGWSCAYTTVVMTDEKESYPPVQHVEVLTERPARAHKVIAILESEGSVWLHHTHLLKSMKTKAGRIGADAIVPFAFERERTPQQLMYDPGVRGYYTFGGWTKPRLKAEAIKYRPSAERGSSQRVLGATGTAWPLSSGLVATCYHNVRRHKTISLIRTDGVRVPAQIAIKDEANDIALLSVANPEILPPGIPIAHGRPNVGARVFTLGYPIPGMMGTAPKLSEGVISALTGVQDDPRTYQITVPVQAGNSGGPLLNMNGEAVGVVVAKLSDVAALWLTGQLPQNVNYARKVEYVKQLEALAAPEPRREPVIQELPRTPSTLENLASRIRDSILILEAE